jgi:hypothetical protein
MDSWEECVLQAVSHCSKFEPIAQWYYAEQYTTASAIAEKKRRRIS